MLLLFTQLYLFMVLDLSMEQMSSYWLSSCYVYVSMISVLSLYFTDINSRFNHAMWKTYLHIFTFCIIFKGASIGVVAPHILLMFISNNRQNEEESIMHVFTFAYPLVIFYELN